MRKYEVGFCEKYTFESVEKYYIEGAGSGNVCAVGVFVTPMDSWMCQQPTWTTTKNLCQTIYTQEKTTLPNNFQTMNISKLSRGVRRGEKMSDNKREQ